MNDLSRYIAVRAQMRPGDVIALAGTKVISKLIGIFSGADISHVLLVHTGIEDGTFRVLVTQSTIEDGKNGVQAAYLSDVLLNYPGKAWLCPLKEELRTHANWAAFNAFVESAESGPGHITYDTPGLFGFLVRGIPIVGPRVMQEEDPKSMFCSGYDVAGLEAAEILRGVNYSQTSPIQLLRMKIFAPGFPVQLIGKPGSFSGYNSV